MASQVRISSAYVKESNSGTNLVFTVSLDQADPTQTVTVEVSTAEDTAIAGSDFTAVSNQVVTFAPGTTTQTIEIPIVDDAIYERTEAFFVKLANPTNATIDPNYAEAVGTILDDDTPPSLSIADVEVDEDGASAVLTVTRTGESTEIITVNYATVDGTAKTGSGDYTSTSGKLVFLPDETTKTITVPILDDTLSEANEKFLVKLSGASNATTAKAEASVTITDDDLAPGLSIGNVTIEETASGTNAVFTVTLSAVSGQTVTVKYATADDTAKAGEDYTTTNGTLTFEPGTTTQQISVPILDNSSFETEESFFINLSEAVGASITQAQGTGTITDSDPEPLASISIDDVTMIEGNSGTTIARFIVSLSAASSRGISVGYALTHGTTTASDVSLPSGTLQFAAGDTEKTIDVLIIGDTIDEIDETFLVKLSSPTNAEIGDGEGEGTITDDDGKPTISIDDEVVVKEGNSGKVAVFTVTLSNATDQVVEVNFATSDDTATASSGDYTAKSDKLTFNPGEALSQQIEIAINDDQVFEPDETFFVKLSDAVNADLGTSQGRATLENDDAPPTLPKLSIADPRRTVEGSDGTTTVTFVVSLSEAVNESVTVDFEVLDGTATIADNDYVSNQGKLTFAAGDTRKTITVTVNSDTKIESDETILVKLSNASTNAEISRAQATGTIANDDRLPKISIGDVLIKEGNSGTTKAVFEVTLDKAHTLPITIDYTTLDETATTSDNEYVATSGKLTFAAGQTSQTITVLVNGDTRLESNETFLVELSNATNATIADDRASATIENDDTDTTPPVLPAVSVNNISLQEGNSGVSSAVFTLSLSAVSTETVTVNYTTADETATDKDYTPVSAGSVTFAPGETTRTVTIAVAGDTEFESDETFRLNLTNAENAEIVGDSGTATLINDDTSPNSPDSSGGGSNGGGNTPGSEIPPSTVTGTPNADSLTGGNDNVIIYGLEGNDVLTGGTGNDFIDGGAGNDTLYGSTGIDLLAGKEGGDRLFGGDGDDVIYGGRGQDQLYGENGNDILYGKKGTDRLFGGDGDDLLVGNLGADRLLGGTGKDQFGFRKVQDKIDRILDFSVQDDLIVISRPGFKAGLKLGTLNAKQLQVGQKASDATDRFIYNQATGALSFDRDGTGEAAQIQIAQLSKNLDLTHRNFVVVATL